MTNENTRRFALKKDGRYFTATFNSCAGVNVPSFSAVSVSGCYSFDIDRAKQLRSVYGGIIVEVVKNETGFGSHEAEYVPSN